MPAGGCPPRRPAVDLEARAKTETPHEAPAADGVLFEREPALALASAALDGLTAGRGAVVAVEGAHGPGKSAVLDVVAREARERGLQILVASGRELEHELELGVALQLFESRVLSAAPKERERLFSGPAATALPLFETGPWAATDSGDAAALVHGVYRLAANMAAAGPLVLAIDDADAADATTLRFLLYLVGRISGLPVAMFDGCRIRGRLRGPGRARRASGPPRDAQVPARAAQRRGHDRMAAGVVLPRCPRCLLRCRPRGRRGQSVADRRACARPGRARAWIPPIRRSRPCAPAPPSRWPEP